METRTAKTFGKNHTEKMFEYYEKFMDTFTGNGRSIYETYKRPSTEKVRIYNDLTRNAVLSSIISHNHHRFVLATISWDTKYKSCYAFRVITPTYIYEIDESLMSDMWDEKHLGFITRP